jgi:DNA-binding transcriptional ArsR family regulator
MATADAVEGVVSGQAPAALRFNVRRSLVIEAVWLSYLHDDESAFPARQRFYEARPWLREYMNELWGSPEGGLTELAILADRGGVLFEDRHDEVVAALGEVSKMRTPFEPLASESAEENDNLRRRLARLASNRERRLGALWFDLVGELLAAVLLSWKRGGRDALEAAERELSGRLPDVGTYANLEAVAKLDCFSCMPQAATDTARKGIPITVVPAYFARKALVLSLPSTLVVAPDLPPVSPGPSEGTRRRAQRLRALGDPTRLAIFEALATHPRSVGELARQIGVAQPTVSNHIRVLREAGLLRPGPGSGRPLSADIEAFDRLFEESRRVLQPLP